MRNSCTVIKKQWKPATCQNSTNVSYIVKLSLWRIASHVFSYIEVKYHLAITTRFEINTWKKLMHASAKLFVREICARFLNLVSESVTRQKMVCQLLKWWQGYQQENSTTFFHFYFFLRYQSFCDRCRNSAHSMFWRVCKKCLKELALKTLGSSNLTNPSKLRIYRRKISTVITETSIAWTSI